MEIRLYNNKSGPEVVLKQLEEIAVKDATVYNSENLLNPTFIFHDSMGVPLNVNYIYVPEYGRYYYTTAELASDGTYLLYCDVDAVASFLNDVMLLPVIIDREEIRNDLYIDAGTYVKGTKNYGTVYNFSGGFNASPENILICCGGVV